MGDDAWASCQRNMARTSTARNKQEWTGRDAQPELGPAAGLSQCRQTKYRQNAPSQSMGLTSERLAPAGMCQNVRIQCLASKNRQRSDGAEADQAILLQQLKLRLPRAAAAKDRGG